MPGDEDMLLLNVDDTLLNDMDVDASHSRERGGPAPLQPPGTPMQGASSQATNTQAHPWGGVGLSLSCESDASTPSGDEHCT